MVKDVILDTNVFVAAGFNSGSASARVLEKVANGELRMIWNMKTRAEIERVIGRIPGLSKRDAQSLFREDGRFRGKTHPERFDYVPDPTDRKFAALADASGATLVSNDDDLLEGREKANIPILTPVEFQDKHRS